MTTIATFPTCEDGHLFRAFLGSNGIESALLDEHVSQLFWHYTQAIGGVRLVVADEDGEEAGRLYQGYMQSLRSGPHPLNPVRAWPLVLLISLFAGGPMLLFGRRAVKSPPREKP